MNKKTRKSDPTWNEEWNWSIDDWGEDFVDENPVELEESDNDGHEHDRAPAGAEPVLLNGKNAEDSPVSPSLLSPRPSEGSVSHDEQEEAKEKVFELALPSPVAVSPLRCDESVLHFDDEAIQSLSEAPFTSNRRRTKSTERRSHRSSSRDRSHRRRHRSSDRSRRHASRERRSPRPSEEGAEKSIEETGTDNNLTHKAGSIDGTGSPSREGSQRHSRRSTSTGERHRAGFSDASSRQDSSRSLDRARRSAHRDGLSRSHHSRTHSSDRRRHRRSSDGGEDSDMRRSHHGSRSRSSSGANRPRDRSGERGTGRRRSSSGHRSRSKTNGRLSQSLHNPVDKAYGEDNDIISTSERRCRRGLKKMLSSAHVERSITIPEAEDDDTHLHEEWGVENEVHAVTS